MNRRETIKSLLLGSVATGLALNGCVSPTDEIKEAAANNLIYGRTSMELLRDQKLYDITFFNEHELLTIAELCDIILPNNKKFSTDSDVGIVEFIEFIVKDISEHQIPIRGGLMWLDSYCNSLYNKEFINCSNNKQIYICDQIAYPGKTISKLLQGEAFFSRMRDLTLTCYFTSKMGIEDLGYMGNAPNVWDGVPSEVLAELGLRYDDDWLAKCVDQSKRNDIAQWDEEGKLIS